MRNAPQAAIVILDRRGLAGEGIIGQLEAAAAGRACDLRGSLRWNEFDRIAAVRTADMNANSGGRLGREIERRSLNVALWRLGRRRPVRILRRCDPL